MEVFRCICVRFNFVGFHNWPEAKGKRSYLAQRHRHRFFVEIELETFHNDREVEFHDFLDFCKAILLKGDGIISGVELGRASCEDIATFLESHITRRYPDRLLKISVFEDNEVGAITRLYREGGREGDKKRERSVPQTLP